MKPLLALIAAPTASVVLSTRFEALEILIVLRLFRHVAIQYRRRMRVL